MRVGLVGAGFMGGVHLDAYASIPDVEVVGVADARIEYAVAGAKMVDARTYTSYDELVAMEEVEVVDVCLPTAFHRDLAVRAAGEGRHVILEKPIARTMEDAQQILDAFSDAGPRLFVGHVVRFFPEYVGIKQKIDAGDLGTVGVVRTSRRSPFLLGWNDWYADWRVSGGVLLDLVIHDFDFLRWTPGEVPDLASGKSPYSKELEHFIQCIATGEEPIVQSQDACEALWIGLAATESVLTGEPVTLGGRE